MIKKPVRRVIPLEEILSDIAEAERILARVEASSDFQALTSSQRTRYRDILSRLRTFINRALGDLSREQAA